MQCLFCKKPISFFRRLKDADFCSNEHRGSFYHQNVKMAAERLLTYNVHPNFNGTAKAGQTVDLGAEEEALCPSDDLILAALTTLEQFDNTMAIDQPEPKAMEAEAAVKRDAPLALNFFNQFVQPMKAAGAQWGREAGDVMEWHQKPQIPRIRLPRRIRRKLSGLSMMKPAMVAQAAAFELAYSGEWVWPMKQCRLPLPLQTGPVGVGDDLENESMLRGERCHQE